MRLSMGDFAGASSVRNEFNVAHQSYVQVSLASNKRQLAKLQDIHDSMMARHGQRDSYDSKGRSATTKGRIPEAVL